MRRIPLTQGYESIVDDEDYDFLCQFKWRVHIKKGETPYARAHVGPVGNRHERQELMHRLILGLGPGELGDHKNGYGLDNRRENLRRCTPTQNAIACKDRTAAEGLRGVQRRTDRPNGTKLWKAHIRVDGRLRGLGYFATAVEAACAYDIAASAHFGEFAQLNFPGGGL